MANVTVTVACVSCVPGSIGASVLREAHRALVVRLRPAREALGHRRDASEADTGGIRERLGLLARIRDRVAKRLRLERVLVRAAEHRAVDLVRPGVRRRVENRPRLRQVVDRDEHRVSGAVAVDPALVRIVRRDGDVLRLDVALLDAGRLDSVDHATHLLRVGGERLPGRRSLGLDADRERGLVGDRGDGSHAGDGDAARRLLRAAGGLGPADAREGDDRRANGDENEYA